MASNVGGSGVPSSDEIKLDTPVTTVIQQRPRPDAVGHYEDWLKEMTEAIGARPAQAAVVVIHDGPREAPPPPREEHVVVRRGYSWNAGHYEWRHHRYVWVHGRPLRERRGYDWVPGHWQHHEDHYDWYRGEWHPHR